MEPDADDLPSVECPDRAEWECLLATLLDRVFWDEDFNDADQLLDASPEQTELVKTLMTIEEDYFTAVPPDPPERSLPGIRTTGLLPKI